MPRTVLETRNLVKRDGGFTAVDDLSFDVYEGDIFTLLAPNGSGKDAPGPHYAFRTGQHKH